MIRYRLLIYEGSDKWVEQTLFRSLPEGKFTIVPDRTILDATGKEIAIPGQSITSITAPEGTVIELPEQPQVSWDRVKETFGRYPFPDAIEYTKARLKHAHETGDK